MRFVEGIRDEECANYCNGKFRAHQGTVMDIKYRFSIVLLSLHDSRRRLLGATRLD
jgi:hypothetical protein